MKNGIVIVGAGHGGSQVAASLRQEGYDGPVRLISDEADLPYHKPPLSKAFLKSPQTQPQPLRAESVYNDNRVDLMFGRKVGALDLAGGRLFLEDGSSVPFDRLVLATGARARLLRVPGADRPNILYLRSASDARRLREALPDAQTVVVVGGGFIGLEAAASIAHLGRQVTVIEAAERLLGRAVSPIVSAHMAKVQAALGVRVLTSTGVERIDGDGRSAVVVTSTGERIGADLVIVGVGAEPNTELALAAGIACDNGISVGPDMATSANGVYAIGDCASYHHWQAGRAVRLESVQNATDQARHVARSILGHADHYREVPWFWSDQGPVKLQMAGLAVGADRHVQGPISDDGAFSIYHFAGDRLLAIDSVNRPADHMLGRRMLAAGFHPDETLVRQGPEALKAALAAYGADPVRR